MQKFKYYSFVIRRVRNEIVLEFSLYTNKPGVFKKSMAGKKISESSMSTLIS